MPARPIVACILEDKAHNHGAVKVNKEVGDHCTDRLRVG
jgi:hypothetical protein